MSCVGQAAAFSAVIRPLRDGRVGRRCGVDALAVVGDLDHDLAGLVAGFDADACPRRFLPARMRSSAVSMPWSTALRTMWVSGSERPSMRRLVQGDVLALDIELDLLAQRCATGPAPRGGTCAKTLPMGCRRVCMITSCSSEVTWLMRWSTAASSRRSSCGDGRAQLVAAQARVRPARFIRLSSNPTFTRSVSSPRERLRSADAAALRERCSAGGGCRPDGCRGPADGYGGSQTDAAGSGAGLRRAPPADSPPERLAIKKTRSAPIAG